MRFRGLDLNLLAAFSMLMRERSVSRAAVRLNLSQPAISAALARLRGHFHDDLLVVEGRRMFPTALAESLAPQIEDVLQSIGEMLDSTEAFDPARSTRTFRIVASDYIVMVLVGKLISDLDAAAPGIRLIVELPSERTPARLDESKVDLVITPEEFASPRHPLETAFEERHVLVGWSGNPALALPSGGTDLFALDHVGVMMGADSPGAFADRQLEQLGQSRRVTITVPTFSAVPWAVIGTTRVGLMHERLAIMMAQHLPLAIRPLPFNFPPMREVFQYHRARQSDPGLQWLVEQLRCRTADKKSDVEMRLPSAAKT